MLALPMLHVRHLLLALKVPFKRVGVCYAWDAEEVDRRVAEAKKK